MTLLSLFQTWWQWVATWMESIMRTASPSSPAPSINACVSLEQLAAHQLSSKNLRDYWALRHWWAVHRLASAVASLQKSTSRTRPTCQVCVFIKKIMEKLQICQGRCIKKGGNLLWSSHKHEHQLLVNVPKSSIWQFSCFHLYVMKT